MSVMLSLASNPHNPFTEYDEWKKFDTREGFDTDGLFARCLSTSFEIGEAAQLRDEKDTALSIVNNPSFKGLYVIVDSDD